MATAPHGMVSYEPPADIHISRACEEAIGIANRRSLPVHFRFNDVDMTVRPGESPLDAADRWAAENDRLAREYRDSPEGRAMAAEMERDRRDSQARTDALIARLPGVVKELDALVRWCVELGHAADNIGVTWDREAVIRQFEAAGYVAGAHVGRPEAEFDDDHPMLGEYIVGQAISCIKKGLPLHPGLTERFAREGGFLPAVAPSHRDI